MRLILPICVLLRDDLYESQEAADKYFKPSISNSNERWLSWLATEFRDNPETEAFKVVYLIFIDESNSIYHESTRNIANEPTAAFSSDLANFLNNPSGNFLANVFAIRTSETATFDAFQAHLFDAVNGISPYTEKLGDYGVSATYEVPLDSDASFYYSKILDLIYS